MCTVRYEFIKVQQVLVYEKVDTVSHSTFIVLETFRHALRNLEAV